MHAEILVITATLGNRETLSKTIESVKQIGGKDVKHIIVAPEYMIPSLQAKYKGIEFLAEAKEKKGIYAALNHGFNTYGHDYKYITFINDDDYWLPNYRLLIDKMLNDEKLDLVYGRTSFINESDIKIGSQTSSGQFKKFTSLAKCGIILLTQQATLIKSELFFKIGGFDENYKLVADTKFWIKVSLIKNLRFKYINAECAAYMLQEGQLSSDKITQKKEHIKLFNEFPDISKSSRLDKLLFRVTNAFIYFERLIKNNKCKRLVVPHSQK